MTRTAKTPAQRAGETVALHERAVDRLTKKLDTTRAEVAQLEVELAATQARLDHARLNPDLTVDDPGAQA